MKGGPEDDVQSATREGECAMGESWRRAEATRNGLSGLLGDGKRDVFWGPWSELGGCDGRKVWGGGYNQVGMEMEKGGEEWKSKAEENTKKGGSGKK